MEVILLEKTGRFGRMGDRVKVKDGFARNYLLPKGKALRATKANIEKFEAQRSAIAAKSDAAKAAAEAESAKIAGKSFVIIRAAGDTGHLFGSVSARDVAEAIRLSGAKAEHANITIDTPIKELGIYKVRVMLHPEVEETVMVNVARSEAEAKVAEELAISGAAVKAEPVSEEASAEAADVVAEEAPADAEVAESAEAAEAEPEAAEAKPAKKAPAKKAPARAKKAKAEE